MRSWTGRNRRNSRFQILDYRKPARISCVPKNYYMEGKCFMNNIYGNSYFVMSIFLLLGIFLPVLTVWLVGPFLRPHKPSKEKNTTYESGLEPTGDAMVQFNVRYYLFALLFVVFDVETVFLYPWAVAYNKLTAFALIEMFIFVFMLVVGLVYAWKKKVLTWN